MARPKRRRRHRSGEEAKGRRLRGWQAVISMVVVGGGVMGQRRWNCEDGCGRSEAKAKADPVSDFLNGGRFQDDK